MINSKKEDQQQIQELIVLNDELENYFRNTIIPQLFVDANMILRKFTPPAMTHFELSSEHIGRPMEEVIDNIRYSSIIENIHAVIDSSQILEKEIQTTDFRWFQMNIIPYRVEKEKKTNGVIITFVDITDRIKILRELEKQNASHETFIYSVSHDLKAPLANIEGLVRLFIKKSDELSGEPGTASVGQKQIAPMLEQSVKTMRNIINELSEITKLDNPSQKTVEVVNFSSLLRDVCLTIRNEINESNAQIQIEINEPDIEFSRKNLRSILYNLLSNAIKYRVPDRTPEIHIKIEKANGFVKLSVKDNGLGIAADKKDLLFTPFTRLEKHVEGTGIGLYLVKKIVENQGGKISFNSKAGEGTEFQIFLKP